MARRDRGILEALQAFFGVGAVGDSPARKKSWQPESALHEYWEHGMKRRRLCTVDGCDRPQKGHGVCRHHMYVLYGK